MGILNGNPKEEPLHYGEVSIVWAASLTSKSMVACYSTLLNHAGDIDLKKLIQEAITLGQAEIMGLDEVLKEHGVAIPPAPPERPQANLEDIPPGARFQDAEIAAALSRDVAIGMTACSQAMAQCIREDIGAMFAQFHTAKAKLGQSALRLMKEKAWLIVPPLHIEHVKA